MKTRKHDISAPLYLNPNTVVEVCLVRIYSFVSGNVHVRDKLVLFPGPHTAQFNQKQARPIKRLCLKNRNVKYILKIFSRAIAKSQRHSLVHLFKKITRQQEVLFLEKLISLFNEGFYDKK